MAIGRDYEWQAPGGAADADVGAASGVTGGAPVRVACIGVGMMGQHNLKRLLTMPDVTIAAVCDVERNHLEQGLALVREAQGAACDGVRDFRELLKRDDLEAVMISTPDHWHAVQAVMAMRSGLDVYVEKPFSLTLAEGRAVCETVRETGRICQVGCQQRSSAEFRKACELIRNGRLGHVESVEVVIPPNNREPPEDGAPMPVPETLDYELWLGPAPEAPYHERRCHYCFRFVSDYSGGQMTNWGVHMLDIVQWALGADAAGPVAVRGTGTFPDGPLFDTADTVDVTWEYPGGTRVHCTSGMPPHVVFTGTAGTLTVGRGAIETVPASLLEAPLPADAIRLPRSDDHYRNFIDCVRTRREPICPAETGHRSTSVCLIANIAIRLGRPLRWDPVAERFPDDDAANALLARPMRAPWRL